MKICNCLDCRAAMDRASKLVCQQLDDDECARAIMGVAVAYLHAARYTYFKAGDESAVLADLTALQLDGKFNKWGGNSKIDTFPGVVDAMNRYEERRRTEEQDLPKEG